MAAADAELDLMNSLRIDTNELNRGRMLEHLQSSCIIKLGAGARRSEIIWIETRSMDLRPRLSRPRLALHYAQ
jgi:hypothetical protein